MPQERVTPSRIVFTDSCRRTVRVGASTSGASHHEQREPGPWASGTGSGIARPSLIRSGAGTDRIESSGPLWGSVEWSGSTPLSSGDAPLHSTPRQPLGGAGVAPRTSDVRLIFDAHRAALCRTAEPRGAFFTGQGVEGPRVAARAGACTPQLEERPGVTTITVCNGRRAERQHCAPFSQSPGMAMPGRSHASFSPPAVADLASAAAFSQRSVPPPRRGGRCFSWRCAPHR